MASGIGKCNKIRHIVRIRQMLRKWRKKAALSASNRITAGCPPSDVPAGHVAICVGTSCKRFVVHATYLNHPVFKKLLVQAEEEYGFTNRGPLLIPCDESAFEDILRFVSRPDLGNSTRFANLEDSQRCCHVGELQPLLHGLADKSIC